MTRSRSAPFDHENVPPETIVYFSKIKNLFEMLVMIAMATIGLFALLFTQHYIFGIIGLSLGAFMTWNEFTEATNKEAQIVISPKGLQTASVPFFTWEQITGESVVRGRQLKNPDYFLVYNHPLGQAQIRINDFAISPDRLRHLLQVYRSKSRQTPT